MQVAPRSHLCEFANSITWHREAGMHIWIRHHQEKLAPPEMNQSK
jgi:hypothetical protein